MQQVLHSSYMRRGIESLAVVISGASGIRYAIRLLEVLRSMNLEVYVVYTEAAVRVARAEEGVDLTRILESLAPGRVYADSDIDAPISSSSSAPDAAIVIPCSQAMLAKIAHGLSEGLAARTALNMLRLRRPLVLVLRETPLSLIDALNMLLVSLAGAIVLPAAPGFYHKPAKIDDLVDFVVGKVLEVLGLQHNLYERWRGPSG